MVWGEASTAASAPSRDSKVTLIQCSPPANLIAFAFSSAVMGCVRRDAGSRRSDLYRLCSSGGSRG